MRRTSTACLGVLVLVTAASSQQDLRPLRFALEQRAVFDVTSMTRLDLGLAGARTELTLRTSVEAIEVDGEKTRLRFTWEDVYGEVAIRLMTIRFDSRKDVDSDLQDGSPVANRLGKSIVEDIKAPHLALDGFTFDVVVDARGAIVELPELGEKLRALRKKLERAGNHRMVRGVCSEEGVRWQVRMLVPAQPEDGAAVGDTWRRDAVLGLGNSAMARVEAKIEHELRSIEDGRATIEWRGESEIASERVRVKESSIRGTQVLSADDGLPLEVDVDFELDVSVRGLTNAVIDQRVNASFEVLRIEKPDPPTSRPTDRKAK